MRRVRIDGEAYDHDGVTYTPAYGPLRRSGEVTRGADIGLGILALAVSFVRTCPAPFALVVLVAWGVPDGTDAIASVWRTMWDGEGWPAHAAAFGTVGGLVAVQGAWMWLTGHVRGLAAGRP